MSEKTIRREILKLIEKIGIKNYACFVGGSFYFTRFRHTERFFDGIFEPTIGIDKVAKKHNIFVLPSLFEGMPVSLIELMARKRVIIATKVGGNMELLGKPQAGILVERGNPKALAEKIKLLFKKPEKQVEFSKKSYQSFKKKFIGVEPLNLHLKVYENVLKTFNILKKD